MIYAVFLCDKQWIIKKIRHCAPELSLKPGDTLKDLLDQGDMLGTFDEDQHSVEVSVGEAFRGSMLVHAFSEGYLVVFARVSDNKEFIEFQNEYPEHVTWAKDVFVGLFHDEYFQIQQINNQLIDSKRALVRSNRKLEQALKENEEAKEKIQAASLAAQKAMRQAEQANESKTRFLADMSHDIRTPMNAIVGLGKLMEHHINEPEVLKGYISKLQYSSEYLLELLNDVLELNKIENGALELKLEPVDLEVLMEQTAVIIRAQTAEKKQKFDFHADNMENNWIMGDPVRLRQVLMNLLSNAVKYTPKGGTIEFWAEETAAPAAGQSTYRFVVKDNGIGMTKEFLGHIFEPFVQAEQSARKVQGTGLGMVITKNIVDTMGGTIRIESEPGKGSMFEITISFRQAEHIQEKKAVSEYADHTAGPEKKKSEKEHVLSGMRFLCAEDNELNAEILSSTLELAGATCRICGDGKELTDVFERAKPGEYDAILTDIQMPVMDGYEAARRIRKSRNPLGQSIPIIAMTANAFYEDRQKTMDAGMDAHVTKPVDWRALEETIQRVV